MADEDFDIITRRADSLTEDHERLLAALIALRKKHGITQAIVAERMGVSQPTVAGLERYDANPTLSTIRRYALAVGARLLTTVIDDCVTCSGSKAFSAVVKGERPQPKQPVHAAPAVDSWEVGLEPVTVDG